MCSRFEGINERKPSLSTSSKQLRRTGGKVASATGRSPRVSASAADPHWFKSAVIYQLHVRSFCDTTGDGVGDFNGLISKLDYLADLGATALWLQPFYPSPLRDDGYDIADYTGVNPQYGRIEEFREFVKEAHKRGLRVITELVINHTSDKHEWFQRARTSLRGSPAREMYVWSDSPDKYRDARIIFKDFERSNWTWDPVAEQYFWHRFYSHQPDLNFDNPAVHKAVLDVCDFWMDMGVDGVRLDAIPYLYEREGTSCENLPETHAFLRLLRAHVDKMWPGRMLLAEANQWPEDAVAYFGKGDECHMAFHFPLMPRLFMALRMEDRFPIIDILEQTPEIPRSCQWAMFLRNHDELTLEMVTDEERDYMYRVYASDPQARINLGIRRRLAPLLSNNRRKIELMNALLFSMPGTPIMYYGDEIGMGDNVHLGDRNGVRTPMQWSSDRNAGFGRANPQKLFLPAIIDPEYHYEAVNVESQLANPSSLLWWMKRLIALRKRYSVFGDGDIRFLEPSNPRVLAFTRGNSERKVLVVANLSRFVQPVEIALPGLEGMRPIEMFGKVQFPAITRQPYFLSLGPHAFFWFLLEPTTATIEATNSANVPEISVDGAWEKVLLSESLRRALERHLASIVPSARWFMSKARGARSATVVQRMKMPSSIGESDSPTLFLTQFGFTVGEAETYALPMAIRSTVADSQEYRQGMIAKLTNAKGETRELIDGMSEQGFNRAMLRLALTGDEHGENGVRLVGRIVGKREKASALATLPVKMPKLEQSNTTVFFGEKYVLKMFRRIDEGESPEAEIGRHLTKVGFANIAPLAGSVDMVSDEGPVRTLAVVLGFVPSQGDAWGWMLQRAVKFVEAIATMPGDTGRQLADTVKGVSATIPPEVTAVLTEALEASRLLGIRTAEMHAALANAKGDPAFTPEAFSPTYQRSVYQSMRNAVRNSLDTLERSAASLSAKARTMADVLLGAESKLESLIAPLNKGHRKGMRTRIHGDYHLGQVLHTGKDFVIIDFEGEPMRSIGQRKLKRSPLRDLAGMNRSFDYAAWAAVDRHKELMPGARSGEMLAHAARAWSRLTVEALTGAYYERMRTLAPSVLGDDEAEHDLLLRTWLLEKACYEVEYELNARPDWVHIPLRALLSLIGHELDDSIDASKPVPTTQTPGAKS